jgi:2-keto-4-pentenoate hydratase/2-oxohepta-3-ene-1,7-dioic acid hydratase in catechol pathway
MFDVKLVSFNRAGTTGWGVVTPSGVVDMSRRLDGRYPTLRFALAAGGLSEIGYEADRASPDFALSDVELMPPIPDPEKIICVGLNYRAHVGEGGGPVPKFPSLFTRFADTLVAHNAPMIVPKVSSELDYECELAFVIGRPGRHIQPSSAIEHVAGYTCFNDGSVRDYQTSHSLPAGKNFVATAGCGPWLVTADEIPDPDILSLRTILNGVEVQRGNTRDMIFDVATIIAYVSGFTPLASGDIISTGTPEGVGFLRKPPLWLTPGDVVEVEVEGIGILRNPIAAEAD